MTYAQFKASVLGKVIGDGQCVALIHNNAQAYTECLFPGVTWTSILPSVVGAKDLAGHSSKYVTWVVNDHSNAKQLPVQGNIMVFGATPAAGYTNTFANPYGHTGVCDSASSTGYTLLQQNAPNSGQAVNITTYSWKFRPCLGWFVIVPQVVQPNPVAPAVPKEAPSAPVQTQTPDPHPVTSPAPTTPVPDPAPVAPTPTPESNPVQSTPVQEASTPAETQSKTPSQTAPQVKQNFLQKFIAWFIKFFDLK